MKTKNLLVILSLATLLLFTACGQNSKSTSEPVPSPVVEAPVVEVPVAVEKPVEENILPILDNTTGKTMIQVTTYKKEYPLTSYLITSVAGTKALLDQKDNYKKEVYDLDPDLMANTHSHPDHCNMAFMAQYPDVPIIKYVVGDISFDDIHMYSIASSHKGDEILLDHLNNVIVVVEVDGLRIAHMGDIGQTFLTEEQISEIGVIDIAFMQFENSYSNISATDKKGFDVIAQLNPKMIIPTHYTAECVGLLEEIYGPVTEYENLLTITKETLPAATQVVIINNTLRFTP